MEAESKKGPAVHLGLVLFLLGRQTLQRSQEASLAIKQALLHRIATLTSGILEPLEQQVTLLEWHQVEDSYREPAILRWYRAPDCSMRQCVTSLFIATNETCNFWTHFLPVFYFLWRGMALSEQMDFLRDYYTWPLLVYVVTACLYPLVSSIAHAFSAMTTQIRHLCFFLDYSAISLYSFGSGILYRAYVLPDELLESRYSSVFLRGSVINSVVCTVLACLSRFVDEPRLQKIMRLGSFVIPYVWVTLPLLHRVAECSRTSTEAPQLCQESLNYHAAQLFSAGAAAFFYASHLPERWWPGRFDLIGHSHNLLHVFGVTATVMQLEGALLDMESRKATLIENGWALNTTWSGIVACSVILLNVLVIGAFATCITKSSNKDGDRSFTDKKIS